MNRRVLSEQWFMWFTVITDKYCSIRLDDQFCFPLYACAKEVVRQYRKPLEKLGLTYTQYLVMMVLWEHGGMTEGELGKKVHLNSGTLAPLLKRLEKQGKYRLICSRYQRYSRRRQLYGQLLDGSVLSRRISTADSGYNTVLSLYDGRQRGSVEYSGNSALPRRFE